MGVVMEILSLLFLFSFSYVRAVNTGRPRPREIAYGTTVDYSLMKIFYPFMARLIIEGERCGGAVIADRFIATARHCLEPCKCFAKDIRIQQWDRCRECFVKLRESNDYEPDTETVHHIKRIFLPEDSGHPYDEVNKTDLAIIETMDSINSCTESESYRNCWHIRPVKLADPVKHKIIPEQATVRTLGWGGTEQSFSADEQSEWLAQLDVTVNNSVLHYHLLETNVGENDADPCPGDSGGPLLLRDENGEWVLIGTLLGGGFICEVGAVRDSTSEWNKVSVHIQWINSILGGDVVLDKQWLPAEGECGRPARPGFIVEGEATRPGEFPFTALLGYIHTEWRTVWVEQTREIKYMNKTRFECGGTLINHWYVLTAAHCVYKNIIFVRLGEWEALRDPDCAGDICLEKVQDIDIASITKHDSYENEDKNVLNDMALIKLSSPAVLNQVVQIVCLPGNPAAAARELGLRNLRSDLVGKRLTVVGWWYREYDPYTETWDYGDFETANVASSSQQKLETPVLSSSECTKKFGKFLPEDSQICTGGGLCKEEVHCTILKKLQGKIPGTC